MGKLMNVFFHSMSRGTYPDDTNLRVNLLTQRVLAIFPELEYVKVIDVDGFGEYPFSLSLFITETLMGLQSAKNGNFQCDVMGEWVSSEYEKLSGDFAPFEVRIEKNGFWGRKYLRILLESEKSSCVVKQHVSPCLVAEHFFSFCLCCRAV